MNNDVPRFLPILSAVSSVLMLFSTCLRAEDGGDLVATLDSELETEGRPRWYGPRVTVGVPSGIGDEPEYYVEVAAGRNLSWPKGWTLVHFCEPELLFGFASMWYEEDVASSQRFATSLQTAASVLWNRRAVRAAR